MVLHHILHLIEKEAILKTKFISRKIHTVSLDSARVWAHVHSHPHPCMCTHTHAPDHIGPYPSISQTILKSVDSVRV